MDLHTHTSITEIPEGEWDSLLGDDGVPYLYWRFLEALEKTGCVSPEVGWAPLLMTLREEGKLVAAAPGYVKGNSDGEFVFDHSWAQFAYERLGVEYYPKLIVACPFTPATGPRLLVDEKADVAAALRGFAQGMMRVVDELGLSSGHVLFPREEQALAWAEVGLAHRLGVQYHWLNAGYRTFDDFLARYNSKRRHQIRRERAELAKAGIELMVKTGSDLEPDVVDHVYDFYRSTVQKYFWGRQYLNRAFFEEVCSRLSDKVLVVLAKDTASGRVVGGAFNMIGNGRMFGRYWGATEDIRFLHFNVCYYQGIEECIRRDLGVFEPGAGGEHKVVRGFEPTLTHSVHYLAHPRLDFAVREFLSREREGVRARLQEESPILRTAR